MNFFKWNNDGNEGEGDSDSQSSKTEVKDSSDGNKTPSHESIEDMREKRLKRFNNGTGSDATLSTPATSQSCIVIAEEEEKMMITTPTVVQSKNQVSPRHSLKTILSHIFDLPSFDASFDDLLDDDGGTGNPVTDIFTRILSIESPPVGSSRTSAIAYLSHVWNRADAEQKLHSLQYRHISQNSDIPIDSIMRSITSQALSYSSSLLQCRDIFPASLWFECVNSGQDVLNYLSSPAKLIVFVENLFVEMETSECLGEVLSQAFDIIYIMLSSSKPDPLSSLSLLLSVLASHPKSSSSLTTHRLFSLPDNRRGDVDRSLLSSLSSNQYQSSMAIQALHIRSLPIQPQLSSQIMQGSAIEHLTILGQCLSIGVHPFGQTVMTSFMSSTSSSAGEVDRTMRTYRTQLVSARDLCSQIMFSLVKSNAVNRRLLMLWSKDLVELNHHAERQELNPMDTGSFNLLMNMSAVMLKQCRPFATKMDKVNAINWKSQHNNNKRVPLCNLSDDSANTHDDDDDVNFITQIIFLTYASLHIGPVQEANRHNYLHRYLGQMQHRAAGGANATAQQQFNQGIARKLAIETTLLESDYLNDVMMFVEFVSSGVLSLMKKSTANENDLYVMFTSSESSSSSSSSLTAICRMLDQSWIEDLIDLMLLIAQYSPKSLTSSSSSSLLHVVIILLSKAFLVTSPHLRAKMGDLIYYLHLPLNARPDAERRHVIAMGGDVGIGRTLLDSMLIAACLAPSLLTLYGDVEFTGHYEKIGYRIRIACMLKHLWQQPAHRNSLRKLTMDSTTFISFANGLVNETNSLVNSLFDKLASIRQGRVGRSDVDGWNRMSGDEQTRLTSMLEEDEGHVKGSCLLFYETMDMMSFLTEDDLVRQSFLAPELFGRFASAVLSILSRLVGKKGLELKMTNPEALEFRPKEMLRLVVCVMKNFLNVVSFPAAMSSSGYYHPDLLPCAYNTIKRLGILSGDDLALFRRLVDDVQTISASAGEVDLTDAPDEYLDALLYTVMRDPVKLPSSGMIVDRISISQHLMNDHRDPFDRVNLTIDMVVPQEELKQKIDDWILSKQIRK